MNKGVESPTGQGSSPRVTDSGSTASGSGLGFGKKVGINGAMLLVLGVVVVIAVALVVMYLAPFGWMEGVGP